MKFIQSLYLISFLLIFIIVISGCQQEIKPPIDADKKVNLANTFYNNELFEAAISEYQDYIENYKVESNKRANINYRIAEIYFERLHDYNKALEYYFRVKYLYPESKLQSEVGKRIVNCLERLQRSQDAQRTLAKETALRSDEVEEHRPGEVIANIGDKEVTQGDLDFELKQLPPYLQSQLNSRDKKLKFLQQYIAEELLYDSAKRKGLDQDKEIIEGTFRAKKKLMTQRILSEEIQNKVDIKEADVELYYKANKDKYAEKDDKGKIKRQKSFQEVAQEVANDIVRERQLLAYQELIDNLLKAENVKIYENKIK